VGDVVNQAGLVPSCLAAAAICAAMLVLASCSPNPVPPKSSGFAMAAAAPAAPGADLSELEGTYWRLTQLEGRDKSRSSIILRITGGSVGFSEPTYVAQFPFRHESGRLIFSPAGNWTGTVDSGSAADPGIFERALQGGLSYRMDGGLLSFINTEGRSVIVAELIHPTGPENRQWRVIRYRNGGSLVPTRSTFPPSITLFNGITEGSSGCGGLVGSYRLKGRDLEIGMGWLLIGACDQPDFAAQNTAVVNAFSGRRRADVSGDRMWLYSDDGLVQVELTAAPASAGRN
jgi:heat shock protein HslJ